MAQRIVRPGSAPPSGSHAPVPPSNLGGKVSGAKNSVLSILKDTNWPKEASNDVRAFAETMETQLALDKVPNEEEEVPEQLKLALERLLEHLEKAKTRLKKESQKYDPKKKGFRQELKKFVSKNNPNECAEVVRNCRDDVVKSWTALSDILNNLYPENEQPSSRAAGSSAGDNAGGPVGDHGAQTASTPNLTMNVKSHPGTTSIPSNESPDQSVPQIGQLTSSKAGKQKATLGRDGWLNSVNKAFKIAEGASGALPVVGAYVGAVAKVGLTVVEMVQTMDGNDETAERLGDHVCRLSDVLDRFRKDPQGSEKTQTTNGMNELQRELRSVQDQVEELRSQQNMEKVWSSEVNTEKLKTLQEQVRAALEELQLLVNLNVSILVTELHSGSEQAEQRRLLNLLGDGKYGAQGNRIENVTCLPGTRIEILQRIDGWIRNESNSERVLWIRGMAGRGKSTIASTVAHNWKRRAASAIFHFRRGQNKLDHKLICSLAWQLGKSVDPELRNAILSSVRENENIADLRLDEQFTTLFVTPLSAVNPGSFPVLIIVDALDECESVDYAVDFVKLIEQKLPSFPDNVKFLLTSRPEAPLLDALEPMEWQTEGLDACVEVDGDIERFLQHRFSEMRKIRRIKEDWPSPAIIGKLVQMSQGLFQWARTVMKYISEGSPRARLTEILEAPEEWGGVDELYTQILSKAVEKVNPSPSKHDLLLSLVGTLLSAPYPVSLEVVAFLHSDDASIVGRNPGEVFSFLREEILAGLNSLFLIPESSSEPIQLMHTSIRDLLVDRRRCGERPYWVDLARNHQRLAGVCTRRMNLHLRKNICGLSDLSIPSSGVQDIVERELSRGVQYCCRSWAIHLTESGRWNESGVDGLALGEAGFTLFSNEKVLYWLEAMSLVGAFNEAILMAKQVHQWLLHYSSEESGASLLVGLWNDVHRFAIAFSEPIALSPLHIYISALAHCPTQTELWKHYGGDANILTIQGVKPLTWPSDLWSVSVGGIAYSVAFSPDGTLLASGCDDGAIRLLDPDTGRQRGEALIGHPRDARSVCFSPDGKLLASGSWDTTVRLWDPQTSNLIGEPLERHHGTVYSVCFSPDGEVLAAGSSDTTIRLWDPHTGTQIGEPLTGHHGIVHSVCFSPDGKVLASGSDDNTIRLWDPHTVSQTGEPLAGHHGGVRSVCFSPSGKLLASGSSDNTIRLWDPHTRIQIGEPLTGHHDMVRSVCFSPDGKVLASGSDDNTIRLWDPHTGSQIGGPLIGHHEVVRSVCFSPSGKLLASGSNDDTIRLWDPKSSSQLAEPLTGGNQTVRCLCFSPDNKLLASGSDGGAIRLWDAHTGSQIGAPLRPDQDTVCSVCFQPDGKLLVSGSLDGTIRLWDLQTSSQVGHTLGVYGYGVWSLCFSPDSKILASGSYDSSIRLWDPHAGNQLGETLTGHSQTVRSLCFSRDGNLLASGSDDSTIRLWDPQTANPVGEPLAFRSSLAVKAIWFSSDGKSISGSDVQGHSLTWDVVTREPCDTPSPIPRFVTRLYDNHWVTFSSFRLFWLSTEYWDGSATLCGTRLYVVHGDTLSIFDLSHPLSLYDQFHL